jgi:hypothetical protein
VERDANEPVNGSGVGAIDLQDGSIEHGDGGDVDEHVAEGTQAPKELAGSHVIPSEPSRVPQSGQMRNRGVIPSERQRVEESRSDR